MPSFILSTRLQLRASTYRTSEDCGPSEPGINAIYYSEREVIAVVLVPSEHPGDCGPSEPGITASFYPEHEGAAAELIK